LNHLSLNGDAQSLDVLKEMLQLYAFSNHRSVQQQINGIQQMHCKRTTRRIGADAWRGFCQGTEVTLTFDRDLYVGSSAIVMASVLRHFLALHASVNSFVQVVAMRTQKEGEWKRWPPLAGEQEVM
jgi:type VI secretion system protein ImpG